MSSALGSPWWLGLGLGLGLGFGLLDLVLLLTTNIRMPSFFPLVPLPLEPLLSPMIFLPLFFSPGSLISFQQGFALIIRDSSLCFALPAVSSPWRLLMLMLMLLVRRMIMPILLLRRWRCLCLSRRTLGRTRETGLSLFLHYPPFRGIQRTCLRQCLLRPLTRTR